MKILKAISNTLPRGKNSRAPVTQSNSNTTTIPTKNTKPIEDCYDHVHDGKILGRGQFGEVRKVQRKSDGKEFACKCIQLEKCPEKYRATMMHEAEIAQSLDHPNIAKVYDVFYEQDKIYIVQQLCRGGQLGTLFDRLNQRGSRMYESLARELVKQLLSAICYMHEMGICHRDIKLENLMLAEPESFDSLTIIDFGISTRFVSGIKMTDSVGTLYSTAPEVHLGSYDEKVDMWSAGVFTYMILTGRPVFPTKERNEEKLLKERALHGEISFRGREWDDISLAAKSFVSGLLTRNTRKRMSTKKALRHKWMK